MTLPDRLAVAAVIAAPVVGLGLVLAAGLLVWLTARLADADED